MKRSLPEFRPLRNESGPEPFQLHSEDWNSIVGFFRDHHRLACGPQAPDLGIPHAWKMSSRWDYDLNEWVFVISIPGFVRGWDVAMTTRAALTGPPTRTRLDLPEEIPIEDNKRVRAFLSEYPQFSVSRDNWADVITEDSMQLATGSYRAVPEWLQWNFNILLPEKVETSLANLELRTTNTEEIMEQDKSTARVLKRVEVVLKQPRPIIVPIINDELGAIARDQVEFSIAYARPEESPPWLELSRESPSEITAQTTTTISQALGGADPGFDVCPIATIWLCGPPGKIHEKVPTVEWTPVVEYHTMYSLDYTVNAEINRIPPLRLENPAIGLSGAFVGQVQVDMMNEYFSRMEAIFTEMKVNGAFWTV